MTKKLIPKTQNGKIALGLLLIAYAMLAPPLVGLADSPELVVGVPPLYIWTLFWGCCMGVILLWAAWTDAWGIRTDQIPPEIRDQTDVIGFTDTDDQRSVADDGAVTEAES